MRSRLLLKDISQPGALATSCGLWSPKARSVPALPCTACASPTPHGGPGTGQHQKRSSANAWTPTTRHVEREVSVIRV